MIIAGFLYLIVKMWPAGFYYFVVKSVELAPTPSDPMNEWYPWCPVFSSPTQLLYTHTYDFFYGVSSSPTWSSFFLLPFMFPRIKRRLSSHDVPEVGNLQFYHFWLNVSGLIYSRIQLFNFMTVQRVHRAFFQHHISNEYIVFSSAFPTFSSIHNNWKYKCIEDISLGF